MSVEVGDASFEKGPQRVSVEGLDLILDVTTPPGTHASGAARVHLRDGRLSVDIGDAGGITALNSVTISWVSEADEPERRLPATGRGRSALS